MCRSKLFGTGSPCWVPQPEQEREGPAPADPIPRKVEPIDKLPSDRRQEAALPAEEHGGGLLAAFLRLHPFVGFFCWLADQQYGPEHRPDERVTKLINRSKASHNLYRFCVAGDLFVTLIAAVGLLSLAVMIAAKAVWPPPWIA